MPLVNCILCFLNHALLRAGGITIEACGIFFHDTLTGWTYAFLNMFELESFHESYTLVICQIKFQHYNFLKVRSEWLAMHWRSGSRPWTLCSCPWKWCRPSRKLLAKWLSRCIILSVFLKLIPYSYGSDHAVLIWYIWWESIPVPRLFLAMLKYLLS